MILVFLERSGSQFHRLSLETLAAAQQIGASTSLPVASVVIGSGAQEAPGSGSVYAVDHPLLQQYTADGYTIALEQIIRAKQPTYIFLPHTYTVRDFAPKLATRFEKVLVSDVVSIRAEGDGLVLVRQLFQGKLNADVRISGAGPHFISIQAGAYRADQLQTGSPAVEPFTVQIDPTQMRSKPEEPFRESGRAVDLTAADRIVSVGRGIKEKDNIPIVEELAQALGAELAASRPICDNGWLPMERQVGSSGQTVSPKVYVAVGISGAIQHLVGMKGAKTIVAINKDPEAPIFEVADYGIVGDLFDVVPAITAEIKKTRS
jgi:electron transfer flavoprotein alpha subunit